MNIPSHVAIIMDGNGRWAVDRNQLRHKGHKKGAEVAFDVVKFAIEKRVKYLTLFAFSAENIRRDRKEVRYLVDLMLDNIESKKSFLLDRNVRLFFIGDVKGLSEALYQKSCDLEKQTAQNTGLSLAISLNYGGRQDLAEAFSHLKSREFDAVSLENIHDHLALGRIGFPDPDLLIRSGGEKRISNFLLWNLAYSELFFTDTYWPDFDRTSWEGALASYAKRQRRFGRSSC